MSGQLQAVAERGKKLMVNRFRSLSVSCCVFLYFATFLTFFLAPALAPSTTTSIGILPFFFASFANVVDFGRLYLTTLFGNPGPAPSSELSRFYSRSGWTGLPVKTEIRDVCYPTGDFSLREDGRRNTFLRLLFKRCVELLFTHTCFKHRFMTRLAVLCSIDAPLLLFFMGAGVHDTLSLVAAASFFPGVLFLARTAVWMVSSVSCLLCTSFFRFIISIVSVFFVSIIVAPVWSLLLLSHLLRSGFRTLSTSTPTHPQPLLRSRIGGRSSFFSRRRRRARRRAKAAQQRGSCVFIEQQRVIAERFRPRGKRKVIDANDYDMTDVPPSTRLVETSFATEKPRIPHRAAEFLTRPRTAHQRRFVARLFRHTNGELLRRCQRREFDYDAAPSAGRHFIYMAYHVTTNEAYIGQTSQKMNDRLSQHFSGRRNERGTELSHLFAVDACLPNYVFIPLDEVGENVVLLREAQYQHMFIDLLISSVPCNKGRYRGPRYNHGYNRRPPAERRRLEQARTPRQQQQQQQQQQRQGQVFYSAVRCLRHLRRLSDAETLRELDKMSPTKLSRIGHMIPALDVSLDKKEFLANAVAARRKLKKPTDPTEEDLRVLKFTFTTPGMEEPLRKAWRSAQHLWPFKYPSEKVLFCLKTVPPIASFICNFADVAEDNAPIPPCNCDQFNLPSVRDWKGPDGERHICCTLLEFIDANEEFECLRPLAQAGAKTRIPVFVGHNGTFAEKQADEFVKDMVKKENGSFTPERVEEWCNELKRKLRQLVPNDAEGSMCVTSNQRRAIKSLQKAFVFTLQDRAAQNFSVTCANTWCNVVSRQADELGTRLQEDQVQECIGKVEEAHTKLGLDEPINNMSYLYGIPKFHKPRMAFRPIVGKRHHDPNPWFFPKVQDDHDTVASKAKRSATAQCARNKKPQSLNSGLQGTIRHALRAHLVLLQNNSASSPVINNPLQVVSVLQKKNGFKLLSNSDMASMYSSLEVDRVRRNVSFIVSKHFDEIATELDCDARHLRQAVPIDATAKYNEGAVYNTALQPRPPKDHLYISKEELLDLIEIECMNSVFTFRGTAFKQKAGIAMGSECSAELATLSCAAAELQKNGAASTNGFGTRMRRATTANTVVQIKRDHIFFRYIDDALKADNTPYEFPTSAEYGIKEIVYCDEQPEVDFLGMRLSAASFRPINKNDKSDDKIRTMYPSTIARFPIWSSTIARSTCKGTVLTLTYFLDLPRQGKHW